jgi:hypothetical protein
MNNKLIYVGLDFETDGINLRSLRPLQVGLFVDEPRVEYDSIIQYPLHVTATAGQLDAQKIHGITDLQVRLMGKPPGEVDGEMFRLLAPLYQQGTLVATGYNVGSFDLQILRLHFPLTFSLFGHRTADPNTKAFDIAGNSGNTFDQLKDELNREAQKAMERAGIMVNEHDALSDAAEAVFAMKVRLG